LGTQIAIFETVAAGITSRRPIYPNIGPSAGFASPIVAAIAAVVATVATVVATATVAVATATVVAGWQRYLERRPCQ
jgi:hypothetical protein